MAAESSDSHGPPCVLLAVYFSAAVKECFDCGLCLKQSEVDSVEPGAFEPLLTYLPKSGLFPWDRSPVKSVTFDG